MISCVKCEIIRAKISIGAIRVMFPKISIEDICKRLQNLHGSQYYVAESKIYRLNIHKPNQPDLIYEP